MGAAAYTKLKNMYFGREAAKRKEDIFRSLREDKPMPGLYLITLAQNEADQLDILPSYILFQKTGARLLPVLAGIAIGRTEALDLVREMASDAYKQTGGCRLREFLLRGGTEQLR